MAGASAGFQLGSGVGTVAGPASAPVSNADEARGGIALAVSPRTDAGQALIVAGIGFALLLITIGRSESGVVAKVGRVIEFIVVVAAAVWVVNYAGRSYAAMNPDGVLAAGIRFDT